MSLIKTIDGNEAAAHSAFMTNEVICIYPITPSSTMAELSDDWASKSQKNIWEEIPRVVEMQRSGGRRCRSRLASRRRLDDDVHRVARSLAQDS